ncbi:hypothetical protein CAC42_8025 [Sphaceloma murrayae]|uniref:JmjC domain-containing histone demethylation protein 1 n=1 Tax=Sphaceloma murrayae TaxID=2082308 RepID=A0A2K1QR09_9PEZI|nr:hypothetical protein CAC42_8025 [Sphaceloma murrayae]
MAGMHRPTFKSASEDPSRTKRLRTPDPPAIEPLSPTARPRDSPFFTFIKNYVHNGTAPVAGRTPKQTKIRARKPSQEKNQTSSSDHRRKSSNTIDELAQVAIAVSEPGPSQTWHSSYPFVNTQDHTNAPTRFSWGPPPVPIQPYSRPAKRARSEAEAMYYHRPAPPYVPQPRPATSNVLPHQSVRAPLQTDYEAAELLLGFASHNTHVPPPVPLYNHYSPSLPVPPQLEHHWFRPAPQVYISPHAAPQAPPVPTDPSYLPSPQPTADEAQISSKKYAEHGAFISEESTEDVTQSGKSVQIHTPPEDEAEPVPQAEEQDSRGAQSQQPEGVTTGVEEAKPKRKGWPKGKPRGPRKNGVATASKPRMPTGKRGRRLAAAKAAEQAPLPRRKSFSDFNLYFEGLDTEPPSRSSSVPPHCQYLPGKAKGPGGRKAGARFTKETVCEECKTARESAFGETDAWIGCNGCKKWFHSDCAGFQRKQDTQDVDKFFCALCEPQHGQTTYVRKSTRAHTAVDYAGLNQGVLKTSDDCKEHHYIQSIKDGHFKFDAESFPRMRPELVTAEYFERSACFNQPVLIPAEFNPKPGVLRGTQYENVNMNMGGAADSPSQAAADELLPDFEYESVPDDGQDKLDMVIPQDLTVRKVCELVGPEYPLDVIDTKAQGTENRMWNLGRWADYYELEGEKDIRNVISLEVSATKLGRLLRRPKVVRQIDLQDNVWPKDEPAKSVAFYCLMSAADSYTDFHIDFGGSSVYYHILRGSKTFFFIPPKAKHLKAYEDWNNSPQQNFTFLPYITKECYRVDLFEGDTMLIPSGWIHAVWTPSNSLVIGGNFLTHMHYSMQFRVVEVERNNKTPQKFRYPKFQKVMWYALLRYLREDPLPESVKDVFYSGEKFKRDIPVWQEFDLIGDKMERGSEHYNARYYSQMELDGLTELVSFIFRTVMIAQDRMEGVTVESRKAVIASIPKSYGDPLELAKMFALWVAWKRGNEDPPQWAHPDAGLPEKETNNEPKKISAKMLKQMQRHEAFEAWKLAPGRQSARQREAEAAKTREVQEQDAKLGTPSPLTSTPKTSGLGPKRIACDACRRRRIRCKHKEQLVTSAVPGSSTPGSERRNSREFDAVVIPKMSKSVAAGISPAASDSANKPILSTGTESGIPIAPMHEAADTISVAPLSAPTFVAPSVPSLQSQPSAGDISAKRGRSKACADCRKSKRRCVHDENGQVDPVKEKQAPIPRSNAAKGSSSKKRKSDAHSPEAKRMKHEPEDNHNSEQVYAEALFPAEYKDMQTNIQVAPAVRTDTQAGDPAVVIDPQLADYTEVAVSTPGHQYQPAMTAPEERTTFEQFAAQALQQSNLADAIDPSLKMDSLATERDLGKQRSLVATHDNGSTDSGVAISGTTATETDEPVTTAYAMPPCIDAGGSDVDGTIVQDVDSAHEQRDVSDGQQDTTVFQRDSLDQETEQAPIANSTKADGATEKSAEDLAGPLVDVANGHSSHTELSQSIEQGPPRSRTPLANEPPSLSSASSPLSSARATPEHMVMDASNLNPTPIRQSSRSAKPVERFANGTFAGSLLTQPRPVPGRVNGRKSGSLDPAQGQAGGHLSNGVEEEIKVNGAGSLVNGVPHGVESNTVHVSGDAKAPTTSVSEKARSKTPVVSREKTAEEVRDEESVRLARELAGENFGLRVRRGLS